MVKLFNELRERLLRVGVAPRYVRRYLGELRDHLADLMAEEERAGRSRADAESAALARLGTTDDLARALIEQRHFQSWCVRAPWAVFALAPLSLLAGAYFVACFILWSGWKIFLPGVETPFVPVDGLAIFYFGAGRLLYFCAPVLIGLGMGFVAARQRLNASWLVAGLAPIAFVGATAQVHASHPAVSGGAGKVTMDLAFGPSLQASSAGLIHALVIFALAVLPYLIWRLQRSLTHSA
jgi:hypothetical protein